MVFNTPDLDRHSKMEVALPMSGSAIDCYEDMFKEITRKLYGEDGLPDLSANDRLASTSQDRGLNSMDYEVENPILKPDEHLTAFGLAALMQNGFPLNSGFQCHKPNPGMTLGNPEDKWISSDDTLQWTQSKIATYNPAQKLFRCCECDCAGYLLRVAEHWLGTHSAVRAFHCPQCPYESAWARCVRIHLNRQHNINTDESCDTLTKDNPVLQEILKYLQRLKNRIENNCSKTSSSSTTAQNADYTNQTVPNTSPNTPVPTQVLNSAASTTEQSSNASKRYSCTFCPYATDRRDLFTRHENIHREEKPFQCYVCQKQFNRADHVKKHFLRMHRDHPYDLNRIRRHPPKNASGMSYYQKYNSNTSSQSNDMASLGSLSIPGFNNVSRNLANPRIQPDMKSNGKSGSLSRSSGKKKGEKRFSCCYCSWSGVDNWCLKRHMNTHLKPFVCGLCDYKAARSERLATHVLKVHNKRACGKCNYLADDLNQLSVHQQEQHPSEQRNRSSSGSSSSNVLRTSSFNASASIAPSSIANTNATYSQSQGLLKSHDLTTAAALLQQSNRFLQSDMKTWKNHMPKQHGAARLFNYMEASDGSDPESESRGAEDMSRLNLAHRIQSDFPEAGDVGGPADNDNGEQELPLFVCQACGCEFEDDLSLETHQYTHRAASPAKIDDSKENVDPDSKYKCRLCDACFHNQSAIIGHMASHFSLTKTDQAKPTSFSKRQRKQRQPKKVVLPFWDADEVEVLRHLSGKLRKWRGSLSSSRGGVNRLIDKYMAQLVTRKGLTCTWCKNSSVSKYHTKRSLALHHFWRHSNKRYRCEHCDMVFRHRYQSVLHSSRVHTNQKTHFVPSVLNRETTHLEASAEAACSSQDTSLFFSNSHAVYVPDTTMSNAHKIGMSFFDHSFIHSNNAMSNHMPIIIPTFPPN